MDMLDGPRRNILGTLIISIAVALATPATAQTVPTYPDVHYGTASGLALRMDIYVPNSTCGRVPVVLFLHGGGWLSGGRGEVAPHVQGFLQRGLAVASIDYRLSFQAKFPAQIYDSKGAVRFLRANAATYNLDPNRIGVFGESAGGHLAALLGTTGGVSLVEGNIGGNAGISSRVQAVVDISGPTDLLELGIYHGTDSSEESQLIGHSIPDIADHLEDPAYANWVSLLNSANPILRASGDDPPFYIAHGAEDTLIPPSQATQLNTALRDAGVSTVLRLVPGSEHEIPFSENTAAYNFLANRLPPTSSVSAPQIEGMSNASIIAGSSYQSPTPSLSQPMCMEPVQWSLVQGPSGASVNNSTGIVSWPSPSAGTFTITIRASNEEGTDQESWSLSVSPQAPTNLTRRYTFNGRHSGEMFGKSIANAGDVNADGYDDFIIGAPGNNENGTNAGKVYVYSGRTGGLLMQARGRRPGDQFGYAVSSAGDVNGDGRADLLIGAPFNDDKGSNAGQAYIYAGGSWSVLRTLSGKRAGDRFGSAVAGGLQFDSESRDCFLIGAPYNDDFASNAGIAYLYSGRTYKTLKAIRGSRGGELFGSALARIGRSDGDADDDYIIGAPYNNEAGLLAGKIYVFSGRSAALLYDKKGRRAGDRFGHAVSGAGDANGDQHDDYCAGAYEFDVTSASNAGRVFTFAGASGQKIWKDNGGAANDRLGYCVAGCGDVNRDGFDDVLVGSNTDSERGANAGSATIYSGRNGTVLAKILGEHAGDQCGYAVAPAGDVNRDGKFDVMVAAPFNDAAGSSAGRVSVYLAP